MANKIKTYRALMGATDTSVVLSAPMALALVEDEGKTVIGCNRSLEIGWLLKGQKPTWIFEIPDKIDFKPTTERSGATFVLIDRTGKSCSLYLDNKTLKAFKKDVAKKH